MPSHTHYINDNFLKVQNVTELLKLCTYTLHYMRNAVTWSVKMAVCILLVMDCWCKLIFASLEWIEHVDDDNLKAYCKFCRVFLPAHYAGLTDHAACSKHCKNAIHIENEAFIGSASAMPQKHRMSSSQSFVYKSSMPRKVLSSECDVERSEGLCTLELTVEDETAQHCTGQLLWD